MYGRCGVPELGEKMKLLAKLEVRTDDDTEIETGDEVQAFDDDDDVTRLGLVILIVVVDVTTDRFVFETTEDG